jgi:hypothetical protein
MHVADLLCTPEQPAGAAGPLQHQLKHVQDCWGGQARHTQRALQPLTGLTYSPYNFYAAPVPRINCLVTSSSYVKI